MFTQIKFQISRVYSICPLEIKVEEKPFRLFRATISMHNNNKRKQSLSLLLALYRVRSLRNFIVWHGLHISICASYILICWIVYKNRIFSSFARCDVNPNRFLCRKQWNVSCSMVVCVVMCVFSLALHIFLYLCFFGRKSNMRTWPKKNENQPTYAKMRHAM